MPNLPFEIDRLIEVLDLWRRECGIPVVPFGAIVDTETGETFGDLVEKAAAVAGREG